MIFTDSERDIFRKKLKIKVSEWATQNIIVPDGPYAHAKFRTDVNCYLVGIMDTWGKREVEEVIICGAPQVGKTLLLHTCIAYCVDYRPAPRMLAMPDDETMKSIADEKLIKLLKKCRTTGKKYEKIKGRKISFKDSTNIWLSSAASPSQRASISVQDLFLDEEALYMRYQGKGDPVTDFIERTNSYPNTRKILRISKPVGNNSSIATAVETADEKREYYCVCPACGVPQIMVEENIMLLENTDDLARIEREKLGRYKCPDCELEWSDGLRDMAVKKGYWQAKEAVANPRRIGFHLPGVLSSSVSLSKVAALKKELESSDDASKHQAYANSIWAKDYKQVVKHTSKDEVIELIDKELSPQTAPADTLVLTCGIDMQKRGFWFEVMAWNSKLKGTIIDYGRLFSFDDVYNLVFNTRYKKENSNESPYLFRALLDSGGGKSDFEDSTRTEEAYAFVSRYGNGIIQLTKGASHKQLIPVRTSILEKMPKSGSKIVGGLQLHIVDTDYFKTLASARLSPKANQPFVLHNGCEESLFMQLTSEELILDGNKRIWKKKKGHPDNHLFDCTCLNLAAVHSSFYPSIQTLAHIDQFGIVPKTEASQKKFKKKKTSSTKGALW